MLNQDFSTQVLNWFAHHGRKDLPWQQNINPYRVWVSEIMLQQTQVKTVIPYFEKFMASFPDVITLANTEEDHVLNHWSGLGYYARARNLHKTAKIVRDDYSGKFPDTLEQLEALPGIGRSTAGAILSIAFDKRAAILDGNVKRVLARFYAIDGWTGKATVLKQLWQHAENNLPGDKPGNKSIRYGHYSQAMMDLGATLCTRNNPDCINCPLNDNCQAYQQGNVLNYPGKKPKKSLPEKSVYVLILQLTGNLVLLEKRPPTGIWGGLWCFPEFESIQVAKAWLGKNLIAKDEVEEHFQFAEELNTLSHTFSHFRLHLTPLKIQLSAQNSLQTNALQKQCVMEADTQLWYNIDTEFTGGLAKPTQTLLDTLGN